MKPFNVIETPIPSPVDAQTYRQVLGSFASGVTIVTAFDQKNSLVGFTANAFTALSLDPPLVLICAKYTSDSYWHIQESGTFAINILAHDQSALAEAFSRKGAEKADGIAYRYSEHGLPLLKNSLSWIECDLSNEYAGGDHAILVGRVLKLTSSKRDCGPLLYYQGQLRESGIRS